MGRSGSLLAIGALALIALNFGLDFLRADAPGGSGRKISQIEKAVIVPDTVAKVEKSVFLVLSSSGGSATAFLVDRACGVFATNAHVADMAADGSQLLVREPLTGRDFLVKSLKIHPARDMLANLVDAYGPTLVFDNGTFQPVTTYWGYDAALLYVEGADCQNPDALGLPEALSIATPDMLKAVRAGDAVALIGYPGAGTTTDDFEDLTVSPRADIGHLRAIGCFIPCLAGTEREDRLNQLLIHILPTTPGTSGSPIFDNDGTVLGINVGATGGRNELDYLGYERLAHRADIISELMNGDEARLTADYQASIGTSLSQYWSAGKFLEYLNVQVAEDISAAEGINLVLAEYSPGQFRFGDVQDRFVTPGNQFATPYAIDGTGRYSYQTATLQGGRTYLISALDYDINLQLPNQLKAEGYYEHLCPMGIAVRLAGMQSFQFSPLEQLASAVVSVPPGGPRQAEIVFFRDPMCSADSLSFDAAISSFDRAGPGGLPNTSFFEGLKGRALAGYDWVKERLRIAPRPLAPPA